MQDRERGTGRDPRRDGRQVGGGRDRLQRRQGEEKDEVSSTCTTFVKYVYNKQTSSFEFGFVYFATKAALDAPCLGRLWTYFDINCGQMSTKFPPNWSTDS